MAAPIDLVGRISVLLRAVSNSEPRGLSTTRVAEAAELPRPTTHRLLTSMNREGIVERTGDGLWHVGPELFLLGLGAAPRYDVRSLAQPVLRRLAITTGESASYSVRRGGESVCVLHEEGTFPLRSHVLREGIRFPLGVASAGIAILALMPEAERRTYLESTRLDDAWGPQHARVALEARLDATRGDGYATNPGLIIPGSWGMAAAVLDRDGQPLGAVSLTGIESRFGPERRQLLGGQLMRAALELSVHVERGS